MTVAFKVVQVDPRPLEAERLGLSAGLIAVVERALAKRPEDRFASGEEMAEALEAAAGELDGPVAMPPAIETRAPTPLPAVSDREQTLMLERATNAFAMPPLPERSGARTRGSGTALRTVAGAVALGGLLAVADRRYRQAGRAPQAAPELSPGAVLREQGA